MTIVYDTVLKRPGCAILQAAVGGTPRIANEFPTEVWLTALKAFPVTQEQLALLIQMSKKKV